MNSKGRFTIQISALLAILCCGLFIAMTAIGNGLSPHQIASIVLSVLVIAGLSFAVGCVTAFASSNRPTP